DANTNNTNLLNAVSAPVSAVGPSRALNDDEPSYPDDPLMPHLEDIFASPSEGIFTNSSYDDEGVVTDFNNLETTVNVSPTPTTRIHTIHQKTQILGDPMSAVQTRSKVKKNSKAHALSAFLYGIIDEEVYVTQPPGFIDLKFPNKVYKVVKALYGLHQAPRAWYATLSTFLERIYVDDIIFGSTKKSWCDEFEELMKNRFQMSSMGELAFFLGLQVKQKEDGIFISQDKYVAEILKKFDFLSMKTASTPIETQKPLVKDEEAVDVDVYLYRKSTTGGCQFLGRRLILWQCKKQTIVAISTIEAEYVVAAHCCGQFLWIQNQLLDYRFNLMNTKIYIDNESIICIVKNPVFHSKTKHIEIRHHFIRDAYEKKLIQVLKIHTDDNVADLLTKAFDVSSKELASPKQTTLGKDESNPLIVDSLLKTICSSMHHVIAMKHWLFQSKWLLFWSTTKVKTVNDEVRVQALIDAKRVTIKESSIRCTLKLDDEEGISFLANDDIFTGLANMGYKKIALVLKPPPKMNLPALWHQKSYVLPQTRSLTSQVDHQLGDVSHYQDIYDNPSLSNKVFANIKRHKSKKQQPIALKVPSPEPSPEHQLPSPSNDPIPDAVRGGEQGFKEKSFKTTQVDTAAPVENIEKSFKQGRIIADIDEDVEDIDEEEPAEVEEVLEVVKAAKLFTEVVTTAEPTTTTTAQVPKSSAPRRRRGVIIQDPKEIAASLIMHTENDVVEQVKRSERQNNEVMRYQALKRKPLTEAQARKNMMIYLKNMASFKMDFFKGMTYTEIRPLFKKHYNLNQAFLERVEEEIMANDDVDVYTEATPLASKGPVVDYQIHHENNKSYYKIIRVDGTHKLFLSFITLLKNFDREDLETLWKLVKESHECYSNVKCMSHCADVGSHNDHSMGTLPTGANIREQHIIHESQHDIVGTYVTLMSNAQPNSRPDLRRLA
nr:hypothetical protein [Tanacetum cinerariifolium]